MNFLCLCNNIPTAPSWGIERFATVFHKENTEPKLPNVRVLIHSYNKQSLNKKQRILAVTKQDHLIGKLRDHYITQIMRIDL